MTLREYLDLNNITLTELSKKTQISISLLSKILNNKEKATERTRKHFENANIFIDLDVENKPNKKDLKVIIDELRNENRYLKTMIMKLHDNLLTQKLLLDDIEKIMKERIKRKDIVGRKKLYKTNNLLELNTFGKGENTL